MYLIRGQKNIKLFKKRFPEISLSATIGNFDGMHLGHKAILKKVKKNAREKNLSSLVIFTEPHAAEFFSKINNSTPPPRIIPWRDKLRLISENGIDFCMLLKFDESLTDARYALGECLYDQGQFAKATPHFNKVHSNFFSKGS